MRIITPKRHEAGYLYHTCPVTGRLFEVNNGDELVVIYGVTGYVPVTRRGYMLSCCGRCEVELLDTKYRVYNDSSTTILLESEPPKAHDNVRGVSGLDLLKLVEYDRLEPKLDGCRAIVHCTPNGVFITSRRRDSTGGFRQFQDNVPHLRDHPVLVKLGQVGYTILDGEAIMTPTGERDTLSMTMGVVGAKPEAAVAFQAQYGLATLWLFDAQRIYDQDIESLSLDGRRRMMQDVIPTPLDDYIKFIPVHKVLRTPSKQGLLNMYLLKGYEGVVLKRSDAGYRDSRAWLKVKQKLTLDCQVLHWERGTEGGKYSDTVGALSVGVLDQDGLLREVATVNPGDDERRAWFLKLFGNRPPRDPGDGTVDSYIIEGNLIVEVEGQLMTRDKRIRHPRIVRWRHDRSEPNEIDFR